MKIEFRRDKTLTEPLVIVSAPELTQEAQHILDLLGEIEPSAINGYSETGVERLRQADIVRIYGERQKVFAETKSGHFALHARLYELEQALSPVLFVRISNSEIVGSRHIRRLDASITGTICLHMDNGSKAYASRRYVARLKKHFGL